MNASQRAGASIRQGAVSYARLRAPLRDGLDVLASALEVQEPALLGEYARWSSRLALARNDPSNDRAAFFKGLREAVQVPAGTQALLVDQFLRDAETWALTGVVPDENRGIADNANAQRFLGLLLKYDVAGAGKVVEGAVARGFSMGQVHREILEPALIETGVRWERAQLTVAQEHFVSDATRGIMTTLVQIAPHPPPREQTFIALCMEGERHDLGLRMLHDQLAVRGWKTIWLGADVPTRGLATVVQANAPAVVGLSVSLTTNLHHIADAMTSIRAMDKRLRVMVGGKPFLAIADLWERVGADAVAQDAASGTSTAERLGDELALSP
jgi:methanogenic corrinoid protein MtbC1